MRRYEVGYSCPDTNGEYVNIWDNLKRGNESWSHKNYAYGKVLKLNKNEYIRLEKEKNNKTSDIQ